MADFNTSGSSVKHGNAASPEVFTAFASVTSSGEIGWDRSSHDSTKLSATNRTTKPGLISYPDFTFEGTYDPADAQQAAVMTAVQVDDQAENNYQLVLDTSPANTWVITGHVKGFKVNPVAVDGLLTFTGTLAVNTLSES